MHHPTTPRPPRSRRVQALLVVISLLVVGGLTGCSPWKLATAHQLADAAKAYSTKPSQPEQRVLVVGDSTGVGTGATAPTKSMIGLMGQAHPTWLIDNRAVNGAKFVDVVQQLQTAETGYSMVLIMAGGNDVMRGTSPELLRQHIEQALKLAHDKAPHVTVMPCGDVGLAPFFWPPISWLMSSRSKTMHALVSQAAHDDKATYISLLRAAENNPFVLQADALHSADSLHPSNAGYQEWYATLVTQGGLKPLLTPAP